MYALPQSDAWNRSSAGCAQRAGNSRPQHLSCYHLTLEPNTLFAHQPRLYLPDDDASHMMKAEVLRRIAGNTGL